MYMSKRSTTINNWRNIQVLTVMDSLLGPNRIFFDFLKMKKMFKGACLKLATTAVSDRLHAPAIQFLRAEMLPFPKMYNNLLQSDCHKHLPWLLDYYIHI